MTTVTKLTDFERYASTPEQHIVRKLVSDIIATGAGIRVYDGAYNGGDFVTHDPVTNAEAVLALLASTDGDTLHVHGADGGHIGWTVLVWGNDTAVISDYTDNAATNALVAGANNLADELEG